MALAKWIIKILDLESFESKEKLQSEYFLFSTNFVPDSNVGWDFKAEQHEAISLSDPEPNLFRTQLSSQGLEFAGKHFIVEIQFMFYS